MNIESIGLVSKSAGKSAIVKAPPSTPENDNIHEEFAHALKGQKKLLGEKNDQPELPEQLQTKGNKENLGKSLDNADLEQTNDGQKELAELLDAYQFTEDKQNTDSALFALPESLNTPVDTTATQDMSGALALTGLNFTKPAPEALNVTASGENFALGDSLSKLSGFRQSTQSELTLNLQSLEGTETSQQTASLEKQTTLLGLEKASPEVNTEALSVYRPIDNRTDNLAIAKPITHPGWSKDLGEHIVWMNNKDISAAEIKLNPLHLGPISIRIDVDQDQQATIMFMAQHAETKDALEASIPKLRDMLSAQQLNLVNVNISQNHNPGHGKPQSQPLFNDPGSNGQSVDTIANPLDLSQPGHIVSKGLLSLYV